MFIAIETKQTIFLKTDLFIHLLQFKQNRLFLL
jgi:hypothetical protein